MDAVGHRTLQDVHDTLALAKLNLEELNGSPQILKFDEDANGDVTLIQLNKDVMERIEQGESLVIRGLEDDSAVLCTDTHTYDIKQVRTSNTVLILPECTFPAKKKSITEPPQEENLNPSVPSGLVHRNITAWAHTYLELKEIKPLIHRIRKMLEERPYLGPEKEIENDEKTKYTLSEVLNAVQASEQEILTSLLKMGACCIDGYWRILDFGYIVDCLGELFNVIESESWDCKKIPLRELCEKVNDSGELVPEFIVQHLMGFYGTLAKDVHRDESELTYELRDDKVCRFFAEMLLKDVGKFNYQEFLEVWQQSVPEKMMTNIEFLRGLALIDRSTKPETIQLFPVESLPSDPKERFDTLFEAKPKWSKEDISPYIEDLCVKGQTVSTLLTKYTRSSVQGKVKLYSSRKTK